MPFSYKPLFKLLLDRDMTKEDLRTALGLGRNTIAKMGKGEYVSLEVVDKICSYLGVPVNEVIEHKNEENPLESSKVIETYKEHSILQYDSEDGYRVDFGTKRSKEVKDLNEARKLIDY